MREKTAQLFRVCYTPKAREREREEFRPRAEERGEKKFPTISSSHLTSRCSKRSRRRSWSFSNEGFNLVPTHLVNQEQEDRQEDLGLEVWSPSTRRSRRSTPQEVNPNPVSRIYASRFDLCYTWSCIWYVHVIWLWKLFSCKKF